MMYSVVVLPKAEKFYARADAPLAAKLAKAFQTLELNPHRHPNVKPLVGSLRGFFRYRAGNYRLLYQIDSERKLVYVIRIAHRSEAYE
jgi:mRNA interferase RelE/StbE